MKSFEDRARELNRCNPRGGNDVLVANGESLLVPILPPVFTKVEKLRSIACVVDGVEESSLCQPESCSADGRHRDLCLYEPLRDGESEIVPIAIPTAASAKDKHGALFDPYVLQKRVWSNPDAAGGRDRVKRACAGLHDETFGSVLEGGIVDPGGKIPILPVRKGIVNVEADFLLQTVS